MVDEAPPYPGAGVHRPVPLRSIRPVIGGYLQHPTWLHRVPVSLKLFTLLTISLTVSLMRLPVVSGTVLALGTFILCTLRPTAPIVRGLATACSIVVPVVGYHLMTGNIHAAVTSALTFPTLILWATLVSATTTVSQLVNFIERFLTTCGFGEYAARCALCAGIAIRSIPVIQVTVQESVDVLRSRSIRPYPWRVFIPASIGVVRSALETGEAITARGLLDTPDESSVL